MAAEQMAGSGDGLHGNDGDIHRGSPGERAQDPPREPARNLSQDPPREPQRNPPRDPSPARPLDSVDRDILRMLQTDGRASIRSVAERVHVSRANAYARINRLIDDGVIRGFSARVDHERAGQGASAYITLKIVQNSWRTVREELEALPGAAHIALVSGDFDVLLLVHTPDNRTLRELVLTRIQNIPEVLSTRTLLVFEETDLDPQTGQDS
ncbi:winged helix-turn-helix transcriptional regulator [Streptomyces candidus]|uniref:DNA-binding Lrp family transcriptional regulator n=1 Tax=Streptomyces candidus TaxID=67283 RepID=A0A7X0LRC9_9ACTN|nr:winged helix-turn-helix transcriptional regulator [Streptomyces candidus]MBB6437354.1 DNA-binding Lrp family transcriptional regulator [Streptomyces candidus]